MAVFTMLFSMTVLAQTGDEHTIRVTVDGSCLSFDVNPIIENNRVLVPLRTIFEALDCMVNYSEEDGVKTVVAQRGETNLSFQIGSDVLWMNGDSIKLDTPAKIVNGRTLVPIRAISEGLGEQVKWMEDTQTVCVMKKHGQHNIHSQTIEETIKDTDGTQLGSVFYMYPVINNEEKSAFIDQINAEYQARAEATVKEIKTDYFTTASELRAEMGADFQPLAFGNTYEVTTDRMDRLSITDLYYANTGGAHPNTVKESHTFDLKNQKELTLSDVLAGSQAEINKMVYDKFYAYFQQEADLFDSNIEQTLADEISKVNFYLTDDGVTLYFQVYQVAPYAAQYPTVTINYKENANNFRLDLSNAKLNPLTIVLDGNPTTGYEWKVIEMDEDNLAITKEYIPKETSENMVGSGGQYHFNVTGLKAGNCSIKLSYLRANQSLEQAEKSIIYKLYVDKEGEITVLQIMNE